MSKPQDLPAAIIALRLEVARMHGADPARVLKDAGIPSGVLTDPKGRVALEQALKVWGSIIEQTGIHRIGLECGQRARFQTMGILGYVLVNSPSILKALEKFCTYQKLVLPIMRQRLIFQGEQITLRGSLQAAWQEGVQYTIDYILASCQTIIQHSVTRNIQPLAVGFNFPEPGYASHYAGVFKGATLEFDCEHPYLTYRRADLELPITLANDDLYQHFDSLLQEVSDEQAAPYTTATRKLIQQRLKAAIPAIEEVARELAVSVRSLQKHLKREGTSYREILQSVRQDIAIRHLSRTNNNITDIAFLIGFSDISLFSRNFKKWTGLSPSEYRSRQL